MVFGNIVYLLTNDIETLIEISKMCGMKKVKDNFEPLISVEELNSMFEDIVLIPRINPVRTKLILDYNIDWKFSEEKIEINKNIFYWKIFKNVI